MSSRCLYIRLEVCLLDNEKERAAELCRKLAEVYPDAKCSLRYEKPYELLIATRLSAQCTDARVNIVTRRLFERYTSLEDFAQADCAELEEIIRPCGLFHTKAQSIIATAQMLLKDFGGEIPDTMEALLTLPGIGRKTANLILGDIYGKPAIVTDTHCIRICGRLGLSTGKNPEQVERQLRAVIPPEEGSDFCHRIVLFGREYCKAQKPECDICPLRRDCPQTN